MELIQGLLDNNQKVFKPVHKSPWHKKIVNRCSEVITHLANYKLNANNGINVRQGLLFLQPSLDSGSFHICIIGFEFGV
jgi:hypothetical protein